MKKFCVLLLILLKGAYAFAHVEQLFFLEGKLDGRSIVMRIVREDDFYRGEYFFLSDKKNILFRGACKEKDCLLNVSVVNQTTLKEEIIESFQIAENADKSWTGIWNKGSTSSNITLTPIDVSKVDHKYKDVPYVKNLDPLSYIRTSNMVFSKVKTKKINGITLEWLRESFSGVQFIRIKKGLSQSEIELLNRNLTNIHLNNIEGYFWCNTAFKSAPYEFNFNIELVNKNILNISTSLSSDCHGTGMETQSDNLTIDTKTGKTLSLEKLFYAGKDSIPTVNSAEWFSYRYNVFGHLIYAKLKELYPLRFDTSTGNCNFNKTDSWQFPQWRLNDKGILVKPYFPDYLHCASKDEFLIPYKLLESYRRKEF